MDTLPLPLLLRYAGYVIAAITVDAAKTLLVVIIDADD